MKIAIFVIPDPDRESRVFCLHGCRTKQRHWMPDQAGHDRRVQGQDVLFSSLGVQAARLDERLLNIRKKVTTC